MSFQSKLGILLSDGHVFLSHGKTCQFVVFILHFFPFSEKSKIIRQICQNHKALTINSIFHVKLIMTIGYTYKRTLYKLIFLT